MRIVASVIAWLVIALASGVAGALVLSWWGFDWFPSWAQTQRLAGVFLDFLEVLAWPFAVVVLALLFQRPLESLLARMTHAELGRMFSLDAKAEAANESATEAAVEAEEEAAAVRLEQGEAKADRARRVQETLQAMISAMRRHPSQVGEEGIADDRRDTELNSDFQSAKRTRASQGRVVGTWQALSPLQQRTLRDLSAVETTANRLLEDLLGDVELLPVPLPQAFRVLQEVGLIDDAAVEAAYDLADVRNALMHGRAITVDAATHTRSASIELRRALQSARETAAELGLVEERAITRPDSNA
ncbi:hypothetical protein [Leifsonia sp. NPDC058230]|uniref:hypothetical protein n=1 Tax=Leifsonia sp. NPDC058230 TaxID=3346391 RepID=UPI0036DE0241